MARKLQNRIHGMQLFQQRLNGRRGTMLNTGLRTRIICTRLWGSYLSFGIICRRIGFFVSIIFLENFEGFDSNDRFILLRLLGKERNLRYWTFISMLSLPS